MSPGSERSPTARPLPSTSPLASARSPQRLGFALHIERRLDASLDIGRPVTRRESPSIAERLDRLGRTDPLDHARAIIAAAERDPLMANLDGLAGPQRWLDTLDRATDTHRVLERQHSRELDRDLGISL